MFLLTFKKLHFDFQFKFCGCLTYKNTKYCTFTTHTKGLAAANICEYMEICVYPLIKRWFCFFIHSDISLFSKKFLFKFLEICLCYHLGIYVFYSSIINLIIAFPFILKAILLHVPFPLFFSPFLSPFHSFSLWTRIFNIKLK